MRYPVKIYSRALAEVLVGKSEKQQEKIVESFVAFVKKNRDQYNLKKILEEAQSLYLKKAGKKKIVFEFARKVKNIEILKKSFLAEGDVAEEKINPELIAGVKIIVNGEKQFDYSLAKKIKNI